MSKKYHVVFEVTDERYDPRPTVENWAWFGFDDVVNSYIDKQGHRITFQSVVVYDENGVKHDIRRK